MKKLVGLLVISVAMFVAGSFAFAADGLVTYVSGKVEVQRNSEWVTLNVGDLVHPSEMVSTGFQSEAKVKLADSIMYMGPLTRITLEDLSTSSKQDNVNVYLKTGAVRSKVNHRDNKRVNYQVHTAVAVASARGTEYVCFDSNEVLCLEGTIAVAPYVQPVVSNQNSDDESLENVTEEAADEEVADDVASEDVTGEDIAGGETEIAEATSEESVAEVPANPLPANAIQVKANQTVFVSMNSSVSAPVNNIVQTASNIIQSVSTTASKEGIHSSTQIVVQNSSSEKSNIANKNTVNEEPAVPSTGSVIIVPVIKEDPTSSVNVTVTLE